jgi:hypothetical protein
VDGRPKKYKILGAPRHWKREKSAPQGVQTMRIIKLAKNFTDQQLWILHGTHPNEYRQELKPTKDKRNAMIAEATKQAEALGHRLFSNWTPLFNSNRCRKCGLAVSLPNVLANVDAPNAIGGAVTQPCFSHLDSMPEDLFDITDNILADGVEVNKDQGTTL